MTTATTKYEKSTGRAIFLMMIIFVLILVFFFLNILLGSVFIPPDEIFTILSGGEATKASWAAIILNTRLPQALTATFAGASLAVGGLMMQTLFRNPLAGPSVLGVSSGASLGVAVVIMLFGTAGNAVVNLGAVSSNLFIIISAFIGALGVLLLIGLLAGKIRSNTVILIIGIMIAYAVTSIVGILQFYSRSEDLQAYVIWGLGSFANVSWKQMWYFLPALILGLFLSLLLTKPLNALLLGENYAKNLGININRSRLLIILLTGILTADVTAFCGPVAFLGLAVPHLSRNIFRTSDHRINIPGVILTGALLSLFCNLIARMPGFEGALPINAITSVIGAPFVIWVILKRRNIGNDI